MRLIVFLLALFMCQQSEAQSALGGTIRGKTRSGSVKEVGTDTISPNRTALLVSDSVLIALTRQMKTNDSVSQNLLSLIYQFWRNDASSLDNKIGTRDTVLQQVLSTDKLKVTADSTASRSTVKISTMPIISMDSSTTRSTVNVGNFPTTQNVNYDATTTGTNIAAIKTKTDRMNFRNDLFLLTYDTTTTNVNWANDPSIKSKPLMGYDYDNSSWTVPFIDQSTGTTVMGGKTNSDVVVPLKFRDSDGGLSVFTNDTVKVNVVGGGGGSTSLDATDSTNLARSADSSFQRRGVVILGGSITASAGATTIYDSTITRVSMTVTNLNSLASSATAGWGSDSVTNYRKASDYRINVTLTMANTAPANDRAAYVYIVPLYNNNGTWETSMQGTTTAPTLTQGTTTIATPNNLRLLGVLSYTTQNMILRDSWTLSEIYPVCPEGFKVIIINFTGAAVSASSNQVNYTPIFKTQR